MNELKRMSTLIKNVKFFTVVWDLVFASHAVKCGDCDGTLDILHLILLFFISLISGFGEPAIRYDVLGTMDPTSTSRASSAQVFSSYTALHSKCTRPPGVGEYQKYFLYFKLFLIVDGYFNNFFIY